ncbi:MAG: MATE family efflux transporter, partial [Planctomycetota bacterium]|nr:MATE family efflux transporter [Planctomycetota bacterium]
MINDMTKGPPLGLIIRFGWPMLIGGLFQLFYNLIDMLIVGQVNGSRDLAAIGATASATFLVLSVTMGLATACSIVMAQFFGAKKEHMVRVTLASSIYISIICAIGIAVVGVFVSGSLMRILQTPPEIIDGATLYMQICVGGGAGVVIYNSAAAVLRAVGDSRTPLYFLILSSLLNIILDLIFVAGFSMGIKGVGIATVIAQVVSATLCVLYIAWRYPIFHLSLREMRPNWKNIRLILRIGFSLALQGLFIAIGEMTILGVVNSFGTNVVAAYSTCLRVQQFAILLHFTITEAFAVYAGQNLGARCFDRIREGFWKVTGVLMVLCLFSSVLVYFYGDSFVHLFITASDPNLESIV